MAPDRRNLGCLFTQYYEDGHKLSEGVLRGGHLVGRWTSWYPGGHKRQEVEYRRGLPHGRCRFWLEDGALNEQRSGTYRRGVRLDD